MEPKAFASSFGKLRYVRGGEGARRLVMIPGLCGDWSVFEAQIARFQSEFEVVSVDCLGHGGSGSAAPERFMSDSASAIAELARALPPKPTTFVGHSFGGIAVNALISRRAPEDSFAFLDSPCLVESSSLESYRKLGEDILAAPDSAAFVREWFAGFVSGNCAPENWRKTVGAVDSFAPDWIAAAMKAVVAPAAAAVDGAADPRILIVEGSRFFPEGTPLSWSRLYPRASLRRLASDGHFFFLEEPGAFNDALQAFLGS